jgi:cytosine/uracil/thiamine/allantoin permease
MALNEIVNATQPYLTSVGLGTVAAAGTHVAVSGVAGAVDRTRTAFDYMRSRRVGLVAAAVGVGTAVWLHDSGINHDAAFPTVMQYLGATMSGAGIGAASRLGATARDGAIRVAIAAPAAYGVAQLLSSYFN